MSEEIDETNETVSYPPLVQDAIVLTGPTASGKSSIALSLAQRIDGEILSLDSIAVYRGMDIGTAKATRAEREIVPHHLIDLVSPDDEFSVACFLRDAHQCVAEILERGRVPIFVGGTPMFLKGVLRGFDPGPPADWEFRSAVEQDLEQHGIEALRERLRQVDPLAAHRIGPNDSRRMIRALEVARHTGTPISHRQIQFDRQHNPDQCNVFSLQWDRGELHQRINKRVEAMFNDGLLEEVRTLVQQYGDLSRTASQAVGYREVIEWIANGEDDQKSLVEEVSAHTRQLARRQETWLRSFRERRLIELSEPADPEQVAEQIAGSLV
jgi:tRNA dimethylallyltransferase